MLQLVDEWENTSTQYYIILEDLCGECPEINFLIVIDKYDNVIDHFKANDLDIDKIATFSAIMNLSHQKLNKIFTIGEIEQFYLKGILFKRIKCIFPYVSDRRKSNINHQYDL